MSIFKDLFKIAPFEKKEKTILLGESTTKNVDNNLKSVKKPEENLATKYEKKSNNIEKLSSNVSPLERNNNQLEVKKDKNNSLLTTLNLPVKKKLIIFLIECTPEAYEHNEDIQRIIQGSINDNLVCIIRYAREIEMSNVFLSSQYREFMGCMNSGCKDCRFYDAIELLDKSMVNIATDIVKVGDRKYQAGEIELIGIGSAKDTCSKIKKANAIWTFNIFTSCREIKTKYFCIDEPYVINSSAIGFTSIGSMNRNY